MILLNTLAARAEALDPADAAMFGPAAAGEAMAFLPPAAPTPLHGLPGLARRIGVAAIDVKDEGRRLGLGSFKALGGAYAVVRLVLDESGHRLGRALSPADLAAPEVRALAGELTFCCATDGNHGRSVAWGAERVGARSVIFLHAGVSKGRADAIAGFGAEIVRVDGGYDASVDAAARAADERGWILVSDTARPGYEQVPALVMQGYGVLVAEALAALDAPPTHVFVQAGVGGLAAAVFAHLSGVDPRPRCVVVEPDRAACLYESARAGAPVEIAAGEPTVMAMLECQRPSLVAWRILARTADAFMTVTDEEAVEAMIRLARPEAGDPAMVAGESGGAGLAGLLAAAADPATRAALDLGPRSRVLLVNTEGATDPWLYRRLVGLSPDEVAV